MKYKVGDKVVCIKFPSPKLVGIKGFVHEARPTAFYPLIVVFESTIPGIGSSCPMKADEIEPYPKDRQMLFSFMTEAYDESV